MVFAKMWHAIKAVFRALTHKNVNVSSIGTKPIKTIRFIEADSKERKVIHRQTSKRVTLPWYKRKCTHVLITKMVDPDTKEFTGIMIQMIDKGAKNV